MIKILCKIGFVFFLLTSPVYAYLDPGTGNIIIQAILAFIATAITTLSFYWTKVKLFILKLFKKNNNDKEKNSDLN
tara:strand:+ start:121 stop:348 length:228 start_codon:yes stop_codon:yes gene_type:complete